MEENRKKGKINRLENLCREIWTSGNNVITESEKVVGTQSIAIAIGLLLLLFKILDIGLKGGISAVLTTTALFLSIITIIISLLTPTYFIHRRRAQQEIIRKIVKNNYKKNKDEYYSLEEIDRIAKDSSGKVCNKIKIHPLELTRLILIIVTIIFGVAVIVLNMLQ